MCNSKYHAEQTEVEDVDSITYPGSTLTEDVIPQEIKRRLTLATSAMTGLNVIWRSNPISLLIKLKLFWSLLISILLHGCQSWTLTVDMEHRIQTFRYSCHRRTLHILYRDHKTNNCVRQQVTTYTGSHEPLLLIVKCCKLTWYVNVSHHNTSSKI